MVYGVWCIVSLHLCWCQGSKLCHTSKPYRSNQMWGAMLRRLRHSAWHCLGKLTGRALVGVWLVVRKCLARMYKDEEKILQCYRFCNWYWYCHHRLEAAFVMVATNASPPPEPSSCHDHRYGCLRQCDQLLAQRKTARHTHLVCYSPNTTSRRTYTKCLVCSCWP